MADLRIGLIGLGMMGRHHARVLRDISGLEFVAVADQLGDPHNVARGVPLYRSVSELIGVGIDMAVVAVPTALHEEVALELADSGIHTLVEKPIAGTVEAGIRLVEEFERRNLVGGVGHIERFNPALRDLRARIARGELGDIYQIATRRQGPFPSRISDVGVAKDLATHDVDLTAWLAQKRYESVYAQTVMKSGRPHEDMVTVSGHLASGIVTNHIVNWLSPMKERTVVVNGELGCFVADTITADLTFFENGTVATKWDSVAAFRGVSEGSMIRYALAKPEPLRVELEAFRDAVTGAGTDLVTMREGLETLRVAEAALESARTGLVVNL